MAARVFLHCGTAKSGTSYLQELWWRHRDELRERGLLLPGGARQHHFQAAAIVKGRDAIVDRLGPRERQAWDRLLEETRAWPGDVLISNEHFSDSSADAAASALADLASAAHEVHLVVTVRDLGRVLPSAWQQRVKQGTRQAYDTFLTNVRDGDDQKFWRFQDVPSIVERWSAGLPPERVHLIVVPRSGAPRDTLWLRSAAALGVDVDGLSADPSQPNDSLSVVEVELLRRVNDVISPQRRSHEVTKRTKSFARNLLAGSAPRESFVLPVQHTDWVRERSELVIAKLRAGSYDVVGDLDELLPAESSTGRTPDQATDAELLDAASCVVARMIGPDR